MQRSPPQIDTSSSHVGESGATWVSGSQHKHEPGTDPEHDDPVKVGDPEGSLSSDSPTPSLSSSPENVLLDTLVKLAEGARYLSLSRKFTISRHAGHKINQDLACVKLIFKNGRMALLLKIPSKYGITWQKIQSLAKYGGDSRFVFMPHYTDFYTVYNFYTI